MAEKIICGIIGSGRIGRMHIENLLSRVPDAYIKTVADLKIDEMHWLKDFNIPVLTQDYRDIIKDPEVQAVLIFSSTSSHVQCSVEAAQAGKDVFCEKPIDFDILKTQEALKAIAKTGVKYQIGFNRRFDHNHSRLQQLIAAGTIGTPHIIKITSYDSNYDLEYIRDSAKYGGILFDMTIHDFDIARFMMSAFDPNNEVDEVFTYGSVLIDPGFEKAGDHDTVVVNLLFKNGSLAIINNSRQSVYGYDQRIEVFGSKGCATEDNDTPSTVRVFTKDQPSFDKIPWFFMQRYTEAFVEEMKEFIDCIKENRNPSVTGKDGLQAMLLAAAAKKSLLEHRPVKLSEIV